MKKSKKIMLAIIAIVIIGFHGLWYLNYSQFKRLEGYELAVNDYYKEFDGYTISYHLPKYPQFTGNYSISGDNDTVGLILWPKSLIKQKSEMVATIYNEEDKTNYEISVNQNLDYEGEEEDKLVQRLLKEKKERLEECKTKLMEEIK